MADKSTHIPDPLDFHPCNTPRGMDYFDMDSLTGNQQSKLNNHKIETVREHHKFLYKNPQIRAVINIIFRKLLIERPTHDIEHFIGNYFAQSWKQILNDVDQYVDSMIRKPSTFDDSKILLKEEKHVTMEESYKASLMSASIESLPADLLINHIVKEILEEIIERVHDVSQHPGKIQIDVNEGAEDRQTTKSEDDEDDLVFDLGLDFDMDFAAYHEEDDIDNKIDNHQKDNDQNIVETLVGQSSIGISGSKMQIN